MIVTLQMIHEQLSLAGGLTGREAAELLKLKQIHINERAFRHYLTGRSTMPAPVFRALRDLARELSNEVQP